MKALTTALLVICLGIGLSACGSDQVDEPEPDATTAAPYIRFYPDTLQSPGGTITVEALGRDVLDALSTLDWSASEWAQYFSVFTGDSIPTDPTIPPMLGTYSIETDAVRFTPRFPLVAGLSYTARLNRSELLEQLERPSAKPDVLSTTFTLPKEEPTASTYVADVYPSTDRLPMNQLKFYLHFSAPMAEGRSFDHIQLYDRTDEKLVEAPFVEMTPELWDPDQRRFTLLLDPGRIKREVGLNLELGPPLQVGHRYDLVIDSTWRDASGQPLRAEFRKSFEVVEADRTMINPDDWQLRAPGAQTTDPLGLQFTQPLDHALLHRLLIVKHEDGSPVRGTITVTEQETRWHFTPTEPWSAGTYLIEIETILEDLAGNTLRSLFDVDLTDAPPSEVREAETIRTLSFVVGR